MISARNKDVVVIGGGDTGTDCVGTSMRHGCRSLAQFEILDRPPATRQPDNPWPEWPKVFNTVQIEWVKGQNGRLTTQEIPGTEKIWPTQLVLLSMGYLGPEDQLLEQLGVTLDGRSNVMAEYGQYTTNLPGVFSAGDMRRGQSLVVWAINEGRGAAQKIDIYLSKYP